MLRNVLNQRGIINAFNPFGFSERRLHFLVIAKDFTDSQALERRKAARQAHLERMLVAEREGNFIIGGGLLEGPNGTPNGSAVLFNFSSEQELRKYLQDDPYVTGKVWDASTIEIRPMKLASEIPVGVKNI